ncbi:MAG TPA: hypothetical protein VGF12_20730 [Roseateles sp.]|uniref:hypothetical protein n=1 Tax=Roseateles sp. TaxID=1971397 RepID=UPI002EDA42AD
MPAPRHVQARRQSWWLLAVLLPGALAPGISAALAHVRGDFSAWQDPVRMQGAAPSSLPTSIPTTRKTVTRADRRAGRSALDGQRRSPSVAEHLG